MLWDGLFLVVAVVLAVNGWNRGVVASWRGPVAMVAATILVQHFYVDFAAWVTMRLRVSPETAVILGYLMLWFSAEAVLEIVAAMVLRFGPKQRPVFFNRVLGGFYGLAKATVIAVFPLMAASVDNQIPPPPADKSGLVLPQFAGSEGSYLLPGFRKLGTSLLPSIGPYVVSTKPPAFKPNYDSPEDKAETAPARPSGKELDNVLK